MNLSRGSLMRALLRLSGGRERFLLSPADLQPALREGLDDQLNALGAEGFLDYTPSERKGERAYVIHFTREGLAYPRERRRRTRTVWFRLLLAGASAVVTFLVGWLLKLIFS